jgi:hypothetical protein
VQICVQLIAFRIAQGNDVVLVRSRHSVLCLGGMHETPCRLGTMRVRIATLSLLLLCMCGIRITLYGQVTQAHMQGTNASAGKLDTAKCAVNVRHQSSLAPVAAAPCDQAAAFGGTNSWQGLTPWDVPHHVTVRASLLGPCLLHHLMEAIATLIPLTGSGTWRTPSSR